MNDDIDAQLAQAEKEADEFYDKWADVYREQKEKIRKYHVEIRKEEDEAASKRDEAYAKVQKLREIANNRK